MPTILELQTLAASGDPVVADIARQELEKIQAR